MLNNKLGDIFKAALFEKQENHITKCNVKKKELFSVLRFTVSWKNYIAGGDQNRAKRRVNIGLVFANWAETAPNEC